MDKPFDRCFKDLTDHAPEMFLTLVGMLPLGPGWTLDIQRAETSPPVLMPDFVAVATGPAGERLVLHLEFYLDFAAWQPEKMSRYGGSLMAQYGCEVRSVMILIRPGGPGLVPEAGEYCLGGTRISHSNRLIKLWELSAEPILAHQEMRSLFALVPALASDWDSICRVTETIVNGGDEAELSKLLLMLSLKYNEDKIDTLIGRYKMGFGEILMEGSSILRGARDTGRAEGRVEGRAEGREEGRAAGLAEGQAAEARHLLRRALASRFAGLEAMPELDDISDVEALESLLIDHAMKLTDRAPMEHAIRQAASR